MADFNAKRKSYKSGMAEVDGRLFQIEFWNDKHFDLPWAKVSEIVVKPVRPHWFSRKTEMQEVKQVIDSGWMSCNRLDWAMSRIAEFLQRERDDIEELWQIDAFCGISAKD